MLSHKKVHTVRFVDPEELQETLNSFEKNLMAPAIVGQVYDGKILVHGFREEVLTSQDLAEAQSEAKFELQRFVVDLFSSKSGLASPAEAIARLDFLIDSLLSTGAPVKPSQEGTNDGSEVLVEREEISSFGDLFKYLRQSQNLSIEELAAKLSVSKQWITDVELGHTQPNHEFLPMIARHLKTNSRLLNTALSEYEEA